MNFDEKSSNGSIVVSTLVGIVTYLEQITIVIWAITAVVALVINIISLEHKWAERKKRKKDEKKPD